MSFLSSQCSVSCSGIWECLRKSTPQPTVALTPTWATTKAWRATGTTPTRPLQVYVVGSVDSRHKCCNTSKLINILTHYRFLTVWCGVVWCGVVWCGVVWCGVVWCGVVWCGVVSLWCLCVCVYVSRLVGSNIKHLCEFCRKIHGAWIFVGMGGW